MTLHTDSLLTLAMHPDVRLRKQAHHLACDLGLPEPSPGWRAITEEEWVSAEGDFLALEEWCTSEDGEDLICMVYQISEQFGRGTDWSTSLKAAAEELLWTETPDILY